MIYLIGGPPRCGKTLVAQQLSRITGASVVSLDHLGSAIYHYLSAEERALTFPLLPGNIDERYSTNSTAEIIDNYRTIARTLWPAMQVFIHFSLAENRDLILEGYPIEPSFLQEFTPTGTVPEQDLHVLSSYGQMMVQKGTGYALAHGGDTRITAAFLYKEDVTDIVAGLMKSTRENDWILRGKPEQITFSRIATMVSQYGKTIRDEAIRHDLAAFNMDGNFSEHITSVVAFLIEGRSHDGYST